MKFLKATFLIVLLSTLCVEPLKGQNAENGRGITFSVDAGLGIDANPQNFTEFWNAGVGGGLGIGYQISKTLTVQLYGSYHRFSFDEDGFRDNRNLASDINVDGGAAEIGTVMGNVIFHYATVDPTITPYVKIGAGYFRSVRSDIDFEQGGETATLNSNTDATIGINSAIGIDFLLNNSTSLFVEIKYTTALTSDQRTQYLPISIGLTF